MGTTPCKVPGDGGGAYCGGITVRPSTTLELLTLSAYPRREVNEIQALELHDLNFCRSWTQENRPFKIAWLRAAYLAAQLIALLPRRLRCQPIYGQREEAGDVNHLERLKIPARAGRESFEPGFFLPSSNTSVFPRK